MAQAWGRRAAGRLEGRRAGYGRRYGRAGRPVARAGYGGRANAAPGARGERRASRALRRVTVVALWLALLAWPAPQLGMALAQGVSASPLVAQGPQQVGRLAIKIADGLALALAPNAAHQYWQVGLEADASLAHVDGMQAEITTRLPQRPQAGTVNYFWVGSYLRDGSFAQIGYYVTAEEPGMASWFYCVFDAAWRKGPCAYGPAGAAGADGATHRYTLEVARQAGGGQATWLALVDGMTVGQFRWRVGESGENAPAIYAESSGFRAHQGVSRLGPVDFAWGAQGRVVGATVYRGARHMTVAYSAANVCPPYGAQTDGHGGAWLGSGLRCPDHLGLLW